MAPPLCPPHAPSSPHPPDYRLILTTAVPLSDANALDLTYFALFREASARIFLRALAVC